MWTDEWHYENAEIGLYGPGHLQVNQRRCGYTVRKVSERWKQKEVDGSNNRLTADEQLLGTLYQFNTWKTQGDTQHSDFRPTKSASTEQTFRFN